VGEVREVRRVAYIYARVRSGFFGLGIGPWFVEAGFIVCPPPEMNLSRQAILIASINRLTEAVELK
jgi:hypothetical protein